MKDLSVLGSHSLLLISGAIQHPHRAQVEIVQIGLVTGQTIEVGTELIMICDSKAHVSHLWVEHMDQHQCEDLLVGGDRLLQV